VEEAIGKIEAGITDIVEWSRPMYLEKGELNGLGDEEAEAILRESRKKFAVDNLGEFKRLAEEKIKAHKLGRKVDWEKFIALVKKSVEKILEDNNK
jgi:hypothetical protein